MAWPEKDKESVRRMHCACKSHLALIATLLCALACFAAARAEERRDSYQWRETPDADEEKPADIRCEIALPAGNKVKLGEKITVAYRVEVVGAATHIYNPFLDRRVPHAATLAVFSKDERKYLGDLLTSGADVGSKMSADASHWVFCRNKNYVGSEFDVFVMEPFLRPPPYPHNSTPISKPGKYNVQLIFTGRAVSAPGDPHPRQSWESFYTKWKDRVYEEDYCRSNVLEIEVTD